jgi:hypothetical protein
MFVRLSYMLIRLTNGRGEKSGDGFETCIDALDRGVEGGVIPRWRGAARSADFSK